MNTRTARYLRHRFPPEIITFPSGLIKSRHQAQRFLSLRARVNNLFRYGRHLLGAANHRGSVKDVSHFFRRWLVGQAIF